MRSIPPSFAKAATLWVLSLLASSVSAAAPATAKPVVSGQTPRANAPAPTTNGDPQLSAADQFQRMVTALESRRSIAAKVRFSIDEFGQSLVGSGIYLQQSVAVGPTGQGRGAERALRLELKMPVADRLTSVLQVGDGASFWIHEDRPDGISLSYIDLARLRRGLERQPKPGISPTTAWMALGGLPRFVQGLSQNFEFTTVASGQLDQLPMFALGGVWQSNLLVTLLPGQRERIEAGQPADFSKAPRQAPERLVLYIGRDDLFPYRVEFWRKRPAPAAWKLKKAPPVDTLVFAMELYEVRLDAPIDPRQFFYRPGDTPVVDKTDAFLGSFGLKDDVQAKRPLTTVPAQR